MNDELAGALRDLPIWEWPRQRAERPAVTVPGTSALAAGDVAALATQLHRRLSANGVVPGDRVLLATRDVRVAIVAAFAALRAGVLLEVRPDTEEPGRLPPDGYRCVMVSPDTERTDDRALVTVPVHAGGGDAAAGEPDVAYAVHGGGIVGPGETPPGWPTTGSVAATCTRVGLVADLLGLEEHSRVLAVLAPDDAVALQILVGLVQGGRTVVPALSLSQVRQGTSGGLDHVVATRQTARRLCEADALVPSGLRTVVAMGPVTADGLRETLASRFGRDVLVEYGGAGDVPTVAPPPASGIAGVWSWLAATPDEVAITGEGDDLTYRELSRLVERLAPEVAARAGDGAILAVAGRQSDLVVIALAGARAGTDVVVTPATATAATVTALAREANVTAVVVGSGADARGRELAAAVGPHLPVVAIDDVARSGAPAPQTEPVTRAAGSVIAVTSGTTGPPKVLRRPRVGYSPELVGSWHRILGARLGLRGRGRHVVSGDLLQPASLFFALTALHAGQTLHLMPRWSPSEAVRLVTSPDVASAFIVPSKMSAMLAATAKSRPRPARLSSLIHGTTACPEDVKRAMIAWLGPVLYDVYSPSEAAGTYATSTEWLAHPGTVGRPFPGVDVAVVNESGERCAAGEIGRVYLSDTNFSYGDGSDVYARLPGMVSVGDVGYLSDGYLFLVGRETDYINVGGAKYHPTDVEVVVAAIPGVADCAVVGLPDRRMGQLPVAFVVRECGADARAVRLSVLKEARANLPIMKVPVRVIFVPELPRDGYGKLRRRELVDSAVGDT